MLQLIKQGEYCVYPLTTRHFVKGKCHESGVSIGRRSDGDGDCRLHDYQDDKRALLSPSLPPPTAENNRPDL